MIYAILILFIISAYLFIRLSYVEKQIKSLTKQLTDINENKRDKSITIGLLNKNIESLAQEINDAIEIRRQSEADKIKTENNLRQTIADMSHDLRTPLTSIIGYIQLMELDNIDENEKKEYINIAGQRAKALESLLNDFYELSLIESMDYEINLKKLNITKVLQEDVLGRYADFAGMGIKPDIEIPDENIYIIADEKCIERVIENLLSNSIKYAKDKVNIVLKSEKDAAMLKISNTASNLTDQDAEKIFDRFYMADKTRSGNGTGLGLSIVKGLVEKMNGTVSADLKDNVLSIYCRFKAANNSFTKEIS